MRIYVETNFIIAAAVGREPRWKEVLDVAPDAVAIPAVCFMEAMSVLEDLRKAALRFRDQLGSEMADVTRRIGLSKSKEYFAALNVADIQRGALWEEVEETLVGVVAEMTTKAVMLPMPIDVLRNAATEVMKDPTDNLILAHLVADGLVAGAPKYFLSENKNDFSRDEPQQALKSAGIEYFASADALLGHLGAKA